MSIFLVYPRVRYVSRVESLFLFSPPGAPPPSGVALAGSVAERSRSNEVRAVRPRGQKAAACVSEGRWRVRRGGFGASARDNGAVYEQHTGGDE